MCAVRRAADAPTLPVPSRLKRRSPAFCRVLVPSAFRRDAALPLPSLTVGPSGAVLLTQILERWENARAEMQFVLETVNENEARWPHPVLGPLTALQMLTLEEAHTACHARQMEAALGGAPA